MEFLGFNKKRHGISMDDQEKMVMVLSHFVATSMSIGLGLLGLW